MLVVRSEEAHTRLYVKFEISRCTYIHIGRSNIEYEEPLATWMS
jgi:hypothetical protein